MTKQASHTRSSRFTLWACAATASAAIITMTPMLASAGETATTDTQAMTAGQMDHSKMDAMSMTGDADYDFAANMYMHHQKALDMSEMELKNGKDPQMLRMAKDIVAAQKKEMATMKQWMDAHKKP